MSLIRKFKGLFQDNWIDDFSSAPDDGRNSDYEIQLKNAFPESKPAKAILPAGGIAPARLTDMDDSKTGFDADALQKGNPAPEAPPAADPMDDLSTVLDHHIEDLPEIETLGTDVLVDDDFEAESFQDDLIAAPEAAAADIPAIPMEEATPTPAPVPMEAAAPRSTPPPVETSTPELPQMEEVVPETSTETFGDFSDYPESREDAALKRQVDSLMEQHQQNISISGEETVADTAVEKEPAAPVDFEPNPVGLDSQEAFIAEATEAAELENDITQPAFEYKPDPSFDLEEPELAEEKPPKIEFSSNHLEILKRGVRVWNQWRKENPDIEPNLQGANLAGANLSMMLLGSANLSDANLTGANLWGVEFVRANLQSANLSRANLTEANLRWANIKQANLAGANLGSLIFSAADLSGSNLENANLQNANLLKVNLKSANLSGARLQGAELKQANFQEANLNEIDVDAAHLPVS